MSVKSVSRDEPWYVRLKRARDRKGLSQEQLGELCGWISGKGGGAQSRIANYEKGRREPTLADIAMLASQLDMQPAELAYGVITARSVTPDPIDALATRYRISADQVTAALVAVAATSKTNSKRGRQR